MVSTGAEGYEIREVTFEECAYKPRNAKNYWEPPGARKRQGKIFPQNLRRKHISMDTWILDFQLLDLLDDAFLLFLSLLVCGNFYGSPRNLIHG